MPLSTISCCRCGECCGLIVHVTLYDIARMAQHLQLSPREVMESAITVHEARSGLRLKQVAHGRCAYSGEDKLCSIYEGRPWACRVFVCDSDKRAQSQPCWADYYNTPEGLVLFREKEVAEKPTRDYAAKHGAGWHAESFSRGLQEIRAHLEMPYAERIKMQRDAEGHTRVIYYNCTACPQRHVCCAEAPVTLLDIQRIASHFGLPVAGLFETYRVLSESRIIPGILALTSQDGASCPFLGMPGRTCAIEECRPLRCRFFPCPLLTESEPASRFYLSSGGVIEQFQDQVAQAITRKYVEQTGGVWEPTAFHGLSRLMEQLMCDRDAFRRFLQEIESIRDTHGAVDAFDASGPDETRGSGGRPL